MTADLHRRDLLKYLSAAGFSTLALPAADLNAPLYFTKDEFALLDVLTELIVPADDHSPGAHEAGVARYIDRTVAEAVLPDERTSWRKGLAAIDELSRNMYGVGFVEETGDQQRALLTKIAAAEQNPRTPSEKFFTQVKQTTAATYYSTSIGIHQEMNYKGNVILEEFVGYEAS